MTLEDLAGPVIAVGVLACFLVTNIRFLCQGRWYRRLDETQKENHPHSEELHAYHGADLPRTQLISGICVGIATVAFLAWRQLGFLKW